MIFFITYIVGYFISLYVLHKYREELGMPDYDSNPPGYISYHDDWDSNAAAFASWSAAWPLFWLACGIFFLFKQILNISKWMGKVTKNKTNASNKTKL